MALPSSGSIEALILAALSAAPEGSNPYVVIEATLSKALRPDYPLNFKYQIFALSGMLALTSIFIALGLARRVSRGPVWLVSTRSGYILPHWQASWSFFAITLFGLLQGTLWRTFQYLDGVRPKDYTLWKTLVWIPAWLAGWFATWVLGVSYLLNVKSKGITVTSRLASPASVNTIAILVPTLYIGSIVGLSVAVARAYQELLNIVAGIRAELAEGAQTWDGTAFSVADLGPEIEAFGRLAGPSTALIDRIAWTFGISFGWGILLFFGIAGVAYLQLRSIRKIIHKATGFFDGALSSENNNNNPAHQSSRASSDNALRWSLGTLSVTVTCFLLIDVATCGLSLWIALTAASTLTTPLALEVSTLGTVYVFVAFAFPTSILLLVRAMRQPGPPRASQSTEQEVSYNTHRLNLARRAGAAEPVDPTLAQFAWSEGTSDRAETPDSPVDLYRSGNGPFQNNVYKMEALRRGG